MTTEIQFGYVKVKHPSVSKPVYLEQAKIVTKGDMSFVTGYEVHKDCEPKIVKGGAVMHLLQLGEGVEISEQIINKTYCELEDTDPKRTITFVEAN